MKKNYLLFSILILTSCLPSRIMKTIEVDISKEFFSKLKPNSKSDYYMDKKIYQDYMVGMKGEKIMLKIYGEHIFNQTLEPLNISGENCPIGGISKATSLHDFQIMDSLNVERLQNQLSFYPEAVEKIKAFDGFTIVLYWSPHFKKKGFKIYDSIAQEHTTLHKNTQIIYLCTALPLDFLDFESFKNR